MILGSGALDHEPGVDFLGFSLIFIDFTRLFDGSGCLGRLPGALFQLFAVACCGSLWYVLAGSGCLGRLPGALSSGSAVRGSGRLWQALAG